MDEQKLYQVFGQELEVPNVVNEKLKQAYTQVKQKEFPGKRWRSWHVRIMLAAAVAAALLCGTAAAYEFYVRQSVEANKPQVAQGIVDGGQPSWEYKEIRSEEGKLLTYWPNRETVPVDEGQVQALLGDYLPESSYQWQIQDYTFTVEGYVLDENTGTAKIYYALERPGGFGEGAIDWEHGWLNNTEYKPSIGFESLSEMEWPWFGGRAYVDVERSTEEKVYVVESVANMSGWKAEDGLQVRFIVGEGNSAIDTYLELPAVKSLPSVAAADPATGQAALELSAIGIKLNCENGETVRYCALEYENGTRYVVWDDENELDNADYGLIEGERPSQVLGKVFNRLVDPSQVAAIIVDGQRYELP